MIKAYNKAETQIYFLEKASGRGYLETCGESVEEVMREDAEGFEKNGIEEEQGKGNEEEYLSNERRWCLLYGVRIQHIEMMILLSREMIL